MKDTKLNFTKLETRSILSGDTPKYIVKGYAVIPEIPHTYKFHKDGLDRVVNTTKSLFTKNFEHSFRNQLKTKKPFIDTEHQLNSNLNIKKITQDLMEKATKAGYDVKGADDIINQMLKTQDIPMFKVRDFNIDDNGLLVELEGNPYYKDLSEDHSNYFDAIWNSMEQRFIDGMSINFVTTDVTIGEDGLEYINDGEVFGISLTGGASIDGASLTEVAIRSIQEFKEVNKMEIRTEQNDGVTDPVTVTGATDPVTPQQPVIDNITTNNIQDDSELKAKIAKLEADNERLKQEEIARQKLTQEEQLKKMQDEIETLKKMKQVQSSNQDPQSVVPQQHPNDTKPVMTAEQQLNSIKNLTFGQLLQLQADFGLHNSENPMTNFYAQKGKSDIVLKK